MNAYSQQPPKYMNLTVIQLLMLNIMSENFNSAVPIDFCLNETTLMALLSNKHPPSIREDLPSILEGHEDDPLDEKQSNFI